MIRVNRIPSLYSLNRKIATVWCVLCFMSSWQPVLPLTSTPTQACRRDSTNPTAAEMSMKAVRIVQFGGEENVQLHDDVPTPKPADDEILIRMKAAGVNPVDIIQREGHFPGIKAPYTAGVDGAGVVQDVGCGIKRFSPGDRVLAVFTSGSHAEYATAKEIHAYHLPEQISFEQGAGIGVPYYSAFSAIYFRAKVQPGETVLVHGASGAVGIACVQILKAQGCRVVGTAGTPEGENHVRNHGADIVYNHREKGYMERIKNEATNGLGVDVILEMSAGINLQEDLQLIATRGRIVVIGTQGPIEIDPLFLLVKECLLTGLNAYQLTASEFEKLHPAINAGLKLGWLKPHIGKVYGMAEARDAQHDVQHTSGLKGKLVIDTSIQ